MTAPSQNCALKQISQLFVELDGSDYAQDPKVTYACIAALLQRMVNPPEHDSPTEEDVTRTAHALTRLVEDEAERVRRVIRKEC